MIRSNVFATAGKAPNETLPAFTDLGGYPLAYFCEDGEPVCPTCVNAIPEFATEDDAQWNVSAVGINWEDDFLFCASCHKAMDAAYTD
jgi:hypothetical protein